MKIVGLTGGIGTGKSTVARMFGMLGAVVIDSDELARSYLLKGMQGYDQVVNRYGKNILDRNLEVDRQKIADIVFRDSAERKWLEQLIHPYVFTRITGEIDKRQGQQGVMIIDVPLLFESGAESWLRPVIVVVCDTQAQIRRIQSRTPYMTYEHILSRIHAQMPIEEKRNKADFVVDNSQDMEHTKKQVERIWTALSQDASA